MFKFKSPEPTKPLTPVQAERQAEAELILARNAAELQALADKAALDAEVRAAEAAQVRAGLAQTAKATRSTVWAGVVQGWAGVVVPYFPLIMFNTLAVFGQLGWGREHLVQIGDGPDSFARWMIAVLFAATLESAALFLAFYANRALNRGDSATSLYLGAFGMAAIVAAVNYSHYAVAATVADPGLSLGPVTIPDPTAMGVVFAMCSLASPWLWRIKHRDANRDKLHALGVIDTKAVRLSMARKIFYPIKSYRVTRMAVWVSETDPAKAVELYEAHRAEVKRFKEAKAKERAELKAQEVAAKAPKATETKVERVDEAKAPAEIPAPREELVALPAAPVAPAAPILPPLPKEAARWPGAWDVLYSTDKAGNRISQNQLAAVHLNKNRHHATALVAAYNAWKELGKHVNGSSTATP
jgi:hypothetical protein